MSIFRRRCGRFNSPLVALAVGLTAAAMAVLASMLVGCGTGKNPDISVSQSQNVDSGNGQTHCTHHSEPAEVGGVVGCMVSTECDGNLDGPDFVALGGAGCPVVVSPSGGAVASDAGAAPSA